MHKRLRMFEFEVNAYLQNLFTFVLSLLFLFISSCYSLVPKKVSWYQGFNQLGSIINNGQLSCLMQKFYAFKNNPNGTFPPKIESLHIPMSKALYHVASMTLRKTFLFSFPTFIDHNLLKLMADAGVSYLWQAGGVLINVCGSPKLMQRQLGLFHRHDKCPANRCSKPVKLVNPGATQAQWG